MKTLIHGDCLEKLKEIPDNSIDSIVTDPPYGLSFMGKKWDYDVPSIEIWKECLRVLKPGGHLLSFAGTRTQHRMAVRIEDAGFEIRDMIAWIYASGFPKSLNIGKAVDKLQGNEREVVGKSNRHNSYAQSDIINPQGNGGIPDLTKGTSEWEGWGTALKPALEPITVARKPLIGTVAENVLTHGTGGINIDGCRVEAPDANLNAVQKNFDAMGYHGASETNGIPTYNPQGRFPANLIHDGSDEVIDLFPSHKPHKMVRNRTDGARHFNNNGEDTGYETVGSIDDPGGSAARFFKECKYTNEDLQGSRLIYQAKASKKDRDEGLEGFEEKTVNSALNTKNGAGERLDGAKSATRSNFHPTVKPTALMRYLVKLVTPPGGTVLDPFTGSGSTGKACKLEGFEFIGVEREEEYVKIARARIEAVSYTPTLL